LTDKTKTIFWEVIKASVGIVLIVWLIRRIEISQVINVIENGNFFLIFVGFLAFGSSRFLEGVRLYVLLKEDGLRLAVALKILLISIFVNNLSAVALGDGYKVVMLKEKTGSWKRPIGMVFLERAIGLGVLLGLGSVYLALYYSRVETIMGTVSFELPANLYIFAIAGLLGCILAIVVLRDRLKVYVAKGAQFIRELRTIVQSIGVSELMMVVFLTGFSHLLLGLKIYVLVKAFQENMALVDTLFVIFFLFIGSYIPITVGSIGVREGITVVTLTVLGIMQPVALGVALVARIIMYVYAVMGGIVFAFVKEKRSLTKPIVKTGEAFETERI
jgi:hypothetical protein